MHDPELFVLLEWVSIGVLISLQPDPTEKNNWKVAIFRPMRRSLMPRRPGWTDNLLNCFLSGLQKLEFGRCSFFFPSWSG